MRYGCLKAIQKISLADGEKRERKIYGKKCVIKNERTNEQKKRIEQKAMYGACYTESVQCT